MTRFGSAQLVSALALLAAGSSLACRPAETGGGSGSAQTVTVSVLPESAEVLPKGSVQFSAAVTGAIDTSVDWKVVETAGGSIDAGGLYVAPSQTGTFHIQVSSHAAPDISALATVVVTPTPTVGVTISPRTASVAVGGALSFSAIVTGTTNTAVTWSITEANCGTISNGSYRAPSTAGTCHVVATSVADATKRDTATVTVTAAPSITVSISPTTGSVDACTTLSFRATVGGTSDSAVGWSVQEGSAGGTITSSGQYTAPSNGGTYHVVATTHATPAATARATVTVTERVVRVTVSPSDLSLQAGQTAQLTATVVTTCGSFASVQSVTAPTN